MALTPSQLKELRRSGLPETGNRVSKAMSLAEMTQAQLAQEIGVTQPYVSAVARGAHHTVTVENARKFAEFFGCSIEDLFPSRQAVA